MTCGQGDYFLTGRLIVVEQYVVNNTGCGGETGAKTHHNPITTNQQSQLIEFAILDFATITASSPSLVRGAAIGVTK